MIELKISDTVRKSFVGADAHIGPLGSYEFAEDYRKNGAICRADVGIGPYTETSGAYVCAVFFHKKALLPAGRTESSAPTQTLKSCVKTWEQQFFDRLQRTRLTARPF